MTLAAEILRLARRHGLTIATAESCTGGLIAAALTDLPGSSEMFDRGFVTYSNQAKMDMLGVTQAALATHGAVSEAVAIEMATGALKRAKVDLAVSVTGIAGPGGSEHKPEGRVCFGLAKRGCETIAETVDFGAQGREMVRGLSRNHALAMIATALTG